MLINKKLTCRTPLLPKPAVSVIRRIRLSGMASGSSVTNFLIFLLLLIAISNYFTFSKIERRMEVEEQEKELETVQYSPESSPPALQVPVYSRQSKELRKKALLSSEQDRLELLRSSKSFDNKAFYGKVKPEAFCAKMERIGEKGDGGKYVCNPVAVRKGNECTLISLGLNNQIDYDTHIQQVTGGHCKILGADKDAQNEKTQKAYAEMNGQLFVGTIPNQLTIPSMLEKAGRNEVELLKIDIEGGEFAGLEPLIKDFFVCQIFIEVHGPSARHLKMLQVMAKYGFRIFNVDPNPLCPSCCEYSLINELCMLQFGAVPLGITIPQPESSQ
ncbi:unnamed protein product [Caenorhabditis sp. 36 PRJEB53466]|nr:unnamed protein product [Caenorhabditis sp. 36 PRJEB53466]